MAFDLTKLQKSVVGTNPQKGAMIFQTGAPLDDRFVVRDKAALISESAFTSIGYLYQGLVCTDRSTGDTYILTDAPSASNNFLKKDAWFQDKTEAAIISEIEKHWKKLAFAADVSNSLDKLTGVFQFKGVAESINAAQTILTLSSASVTKGSNTYAATCQITGYEYDMDVYYGWGEDSSSILFWTDAPTLTASSVQYAATMLSSVQKLVLNGEDYYPVDGTVPAAGGLTPWENVAGKVIYCNDPSAVYSQDDEDSDYLLGEAKLVTYEAYDFVPLSDADKYTVTTDSSATVAAAGNTGHVYQIVENEYASNGNIWVKLGAPTEDWIVL